MKTVEIEDATAPLAAYVREIRKGSAVVLKRGRAMAAVVPLHADEWEDFGHTPRPARRSRKAR